MHKLYTEVLANTGASADPRLRHSKSRRSIKDIAGLSHLEAKNMVCKYFKCEVQALFK